MSFRDQLHERGGMRLARAMVLASTVVWEATPGRVRARVPAHVAGPPSDQDPVYAVQLDLPVLSVAQLADMLRDRPVWAGWLLAGQLPTGLAAQLLPTRLSALHARCSCPDTVEWCKHAMATLLAVDDGGSAPVLIWRGVTWVALQQALYPQTGMASDSEADAAFWSGGPPLRPLRGDRPSIEDVPALDVHGQSLQSVLRGSIARIQREARTLLEGPRHES